jgi:Uma2 family endonuclease
MSALPQHERWTVTDLPEDTGGARYEIYDGSLHVTPTGTNGHGLMAAMLTECLNLSLRPSTLIAASSGLGVSPTSDNYLVPDVVVVNRNVLRKDLTVHPGDVVLVVEVLSPSTRRMDLGTKPFVYADWGIAHYWLLNQETGSRGENPLPERFVAPEPLWMTRAYGRFLEEWASL